MSPAATSTSPASDLLLGPPRPPFDALYELRRKLQGGSYGTVFAGVHRLSEREYAVKVVDRGKLSKHDDECQLQEVGILRSLNPGRFGKPQCGKNSGNGKEQEDNHGIINVVDFYHSPTQYHIVMELARGGDVFDRLAKRKVYTEKCARDLAQQMLSSIDFLHRNGIAHRDIKPENLLLMDTHSDTRLKLADFGFAKRFDTEAPDASMKTKCGTPAFVPPELVLGKKYGPKCDVWSAGCTLFMLLSGRAPFNTKKGGKNAMFRSIRAGDFVFYDDYWKDVSMSAKKMVLDMLHVDPQSRLSAKEAMQTEWMTTEDNVLEEKCLDKSLTEIISFNARRRFKGAIGAVMYAVGGKFWHIETVSIWRDNLHLSDSDGAVNGECEESKNENENDMKYPTFESLYHLDSKLQEGVSATVWEGTMVATKRKYAIKVVRRKDLSQAEDASVLNEVAILKSLRHKHIVPLLDFLETPDHFYLVMHKCDGGDVLDRVASIDQYTEKDACQLSLGLLQAVQFMHKRGIAHRDLKPQNLLLESNDDNTNVKICDFGYAKRVHVPKSLTTLCGSLHYVAPELLKNHPYDESADMWSVGVIIYFLLGGYLPFHMKNQNELFKVIRLGKYSFDHKYWKGVSTEATSLITHLLDVDPCTRYTATQGLQSGWIKSGEEASSLLAKFHLGRSASGISKESLRMKAVAKTVQWLNKSGASVGGKNNNFSSLTVEGVGTEIPSEELSKLNV